MSTPLHPAVVHFPIVLVALLPLVALAAALVIRRGGAVRKSWLPVVAVAALLAASSWVAVETGENEEETVEAVVPRGALHEHEERAELFFPLTVVLLGITTAGLLTVRAAEVVRWGTVGAAAIVAVVGLRLGHSGGELVYVYDAASAYAGPGAVTSDAGAVSALPGDDDEHRP